MSDLAALVSALRAAGGEVFDPLGFGFVESLVARAEALGGGARARLLDRARTRIDALDAALREARATAGQELGALAAEGGLIAPELDEALARGDVTWVRREARRAHRLLVQGRRRVQVPWLTRLQGEALARGTRVSDEVAHGLEGVGRVDGSVERGSHGSAVAAGTALSRTLFRESVESARAAVAVARAVDNVPDAAGPYNGQVLAARALAALADLAPEYLRVIIAAADDLAALEVLLALGAETGKGRAEKRRRTQAAPPKAP